MLEFRAANLSLPQSFDRDLSNWQILAAGRANEYYFLSDMRDAIVANCIAGTWVRTFYLSWWLSRWRAWGKHILHGAD